MTNPFYNASGNPGDRAPGSSQTMRAEFVSIQQGFDKLPTSLSPNTVVVVNPGGTALTTTAYALALGGALTLAGAFTTTGPYATTLAQQANTTLTLPASNATLATLALAETLTNKTLTSPVLNTPTVNNGTFNSPVLVTPQLGTPASGNLSNCTALPIATGVSGLAAGIATFLGTPSSANLLAAMTDETGTGPLVFGTSPTLNTPTLNSATLVTPNLGTPSAGNLANCTSLPINGGTTGTLAVNRGGTGTGTTYATGGVIFAGTSGVYSADVNTLNWNNTDKTLGIGRAAAGGANWRVAIQSFGNSTFPLVITNETQAVTGFFVGQGAAGHFNLQLNNSSNVTTVGLTASGSQYFLGNAASMGIGTNAPVANLGVVSTSGLLNPGDVFRVGAGGYSRFARHGILNVTDSGGATVNQAPFIVSNYNSDPSSYYALYLNPFGPTPGVPNGVVIGHTRVPAAKLDVNGSIATFDTGYFYTPYAGATDTGTVRAGIQVAGNDQTLNFYTANSYRGSVLANGNVYFGFPLGVGMLPTSGWSSLIQLPGDISLLQGGGANAVIFNGYWDGANYRRQTANAFAMWRGEPSSSLFQLWGGPSGTAGATLNPVAHMSVNSGTGNVAIGGTPSGRRLSVYGDVVGEHSIIVENANGGGGTASTAYVSLSTFANNYAGLTVSRNGGVPVAGIVAGASITGINYDSPNATGEHRFYTGGSHRMTVYNSGIFAAVPFSTNSTAGNFFGNLLLQGISGTAGYLRTQDATPLYLGVNNGNFVAVHASGGYFYPVADNAVQLGASGNRWSQIHAFNYYAWGTTSGYTGIVAQAAAANNVVTLPPYTGTLLIGGTQISADLGNTDVLLNNTGVYFNGPSITLPAGGTWEVQSAVIIQDAGGGANFENRLTDGTNIRSSGYVSSYAAGATVQCTLKGFFAGGTTVTHQVIDITSTNGKILSTTLSSGAGQPRASWMTAFRVA